ncbi:hypothetical protein FEM33_07635 [Dyadobacter flavalbus]|uniref:Uncharacterized protein n=1 Tax=Dyadobacter flavalbus TaxID=2579942 RepID=A0A5M8R0C3_9BACT|nr:hypothetical protein [Dyadobacter flavalbus]KAA6440454.1 hypothetical protein FEM33_07635 [Dyadobacter flavalbus]
MKIIYTLLFTLLVHFCLPVNVNSQSVSDAQWISRDTTVGSIDVIAYWNKGEKKKFRAYKVTKNFKADSLLSEKTELDCIVQFTVTDSTEKSYGIEYTMLENKRDTSKDPAIPYEKLNLTNDDLTLRYTTDANGALTGYTNREAVEKKLDDLVQLMSKKAQNDFKSKDEAEKKVLSTVMEKLVNGKVLFSSVYETFISHFHNFHGYHTGLNDTLRFTESTPQAFTSTPIKYDCYIYLSSLDSLNEARFDLEKYADMSGFIKEYGTYLKQVGESAGAKPNEQMQTELAALDMKSEMYTTTYIDLNTGWPAFIKVTRSIITKDPKTNSTFFKDEIWTLTNDLSDQ